MILIGLGFINKKDISDMRAKILVIAKWEF